MDKEILIVGDIINLKEDIKAIAVSFIANYLTDNYLLNLKNKKINLKSQGTNKKYQLHIKDIKITYSLVSYRNVFFQIDKTDLYKVKAGDIIFE